MLPGTRRERLEFPKLMTLSTVVRDLTGVAARFHFRAGAQSICRFTRDTACWSLSSGLFLWDRSAPSATTAAAILSSHPSFTCSPHWFSGMSQGGEIPPRRADIARHRGNTNRRRWKVQQSPLRRRNVEWQPASPDWPAIGPQMGRHKPTPGGH